MTDTNNLTFRRFLLFIFLVNFMQVAVANVTTTALENVTMTAVQMMGTTSIETSVEDCTRGVVKLADNGVCMCLGGEKSCVLLGEMEPPQPHHMVLFAANKDFARLVSVALLRALGLNLLSDANLNYGQTTTSTATPSKTTL